MGNTPPTSDQAIDDFDWLSALLLTLKFNDEGTGEEDLNAKFAEELEFQEALMAAACHSHNSSTIRPKEAQMHSPNPEPKKPVKEIGESSHGFCGICMENKERGAMITVQICSHSFCSECIIKYVEVKIQGKFVCLITCPSFRCKGVLEPETWRSIISKDMLDIYNDTLCELSILDSQKFYCPFNNCSAIMVNDHNGYEVIRESECPVCRRLFCAFCRVPWHAGIGCEEFQSLNEDERGSEDVKVRALAKKNKWNRCCSCSMYVEKNEGCQHITCRCGAEWCYKCGEEWNETHNCQTP